MCIRINGSNGSRGGVRRLGAFSFLVITIIIMDNVIEGSKRYITLLLPHKLLQFLSFLYLLSFLLKSNAVFLSTLWLKFLHVVLIFFRLTPFILVSSRSLISFLFFPFFYPFNFHKACHICVREGMKWLVYGI